jgi:acetyltransferase-like isoleucine patch superfamily enzyme
MSPFLSETPNEIRRQILAYHAASTMSDVERAAFFGLPKGCRMRENAKIISPEKLTIGESCWIGESAVLDASGGLTIGNHTSIGLAVFIWTHDSHQLNIRGQNNRDAQNRIRRKPSRIGNNCFIAGPSVILPGITIGDKCLIAPLSVVDHDLPDRTVFNQRNESAQLRQQVAMLEERLRLMEVSVKDFQAGRTP